MSAQSMAQLSDEIDRHYYWELCKTTWGHLAPEKNRTYNGIIVFAVGIYGNDNLNPTIISCRFEDLDDSPWFFGALEELSRNLGMEEGCVYRWQGTFRNYEFSGTLKRIGNYNGD